MAHYQKALEINPNYIDDAHYNLGILLAETGRIDEAMAHYQKALELNPNHADAHNNLGILLVKMGRTDEAITHFRKVLEINPDAIGALQNLVFTLAQKGQLTDATSVAQEALTSAKSAGDEERVKLIARILTRLSETIGFSRANSKRHAQ